MRVTSHKVTDVTERVARAASCSSSVWKFGSTAPTMCALIDVSPNEWHPIEYRLTNPRRSQYNYNSTYTRAMLVLCVHIRESITLMDNINNGWQRRQFWPLSSFQRIL